MEIKKSNSIATIIMTALAKKGLEVHIKRRAAWLEPKGMKGSFTVIVKNPIDESTMKKTVCFSVTENPIEPWSKEQLRTRENTARVKALRFMGATYGVDYAALSLKDVMPIFMMDIPEARKMFTECLEMLIAGETHAF